MSENKANLQFQGKMRMTGDESQGEGQQKKTNR